MGLAPSHVGAFIGILYAYGVFLGVIGVAWNWFWDHGVPQLRWWQYLLAALAIGSMAFAVEGMGMFCAKASPSATPSAKPDWQLEKLP